MQKECGTNKKNKKSCYYNFCFGIENTFGWLWKKKKKKRLSIVTTQKFYVLGDYFEFFNALVNIEWFFFLSCFYWGEREKDRGGRNTLF